jgi:hypothetical protein
MTPAIIGLSIAYVALAVLLLSLSLTTRWPVWVKLTCIVLLTGFYFLTFHSLNGMRGWPTTVDLPERFLLLDSSVTEPNKSTGTEGVVYIWVKSLQADRPASQPRAFELPYSKELHSRLQEAENRMRNGILQLGRHERRTLSAEETKGLLQFETRRHELYLYDLPDPALPEK